MAWSANDSLGAQNPKAVIQYLRDIGDDEAAALHAKGGTGQGLGLSWFEQVYGYTGVLIGYIPATATKAMSDIETYLFLPPGVSHNIANASDKLARVPMTVSPPGHERYFEELAETVAHGGTADPAKIADLRARYDTDQLSALRK